MKSHWQPDHRSDPRNGRGVARHRGAVVFMVLACGTLSAMQPVSAADTPEMKAYLQRGLEAAMATKEALGGELMRAMKAGGPEGAVAFCNTQALPITQQMSQALGMKVSRVSDRPRNPGNAADAQEREIIGAFKEALASDQRPVPVLREDGDKVTTYYPIITDSKCLACHGVPGDDISPATGAVIEAAYPEDQATGYGVNELRGLFVVTMPR